MQILKKLVPPFLEKWDHHFLINNRLLWATKIHYVAFYGSIWTLLVTLAASFYPIHINYILPDPWSVFTFTFVLSLLGFGLWVYKQVILRNTVNFGGKDIQVAQLRFLIYLFCVALFAAPSFIAGKIIEERVDSMIVDLDIDKDRAALQAGDIYFPSTYNYTYYDQIDNQEVRRLQTDNIFECVSCCSENEASSDKTEKTICESYLHYGFYSDAEEIRTQTVHETGLYYDAFPSLESLQSNPDKEAIIANYIQAFQKYGGNLRVNTQEAVSNFEIEHVYAHLEREKSLVGDKLYEITRFQERDYITVNASTSKLIFILLFGVTLLLQAYSLTPKIEFFITLVTAAFFLMLVPMMSVLIHELIMDVDMDVLVPFGFLIVYGLFAYHTMGIFTLNVFSRMKSVSLVIARAGSPFVFVLFAILALPYMGEQMFLNVLLAGCAFHAAVLIPVFERLNTKLYALPKR